MFDYVEHALGAGGDALAAAYVELLGRRQRRCGASESTPTSPPPRSRRSSRPSTARLRDSHWTAASAAGAEPTAARVPVA